MTETSGWSRPASAPRRVFDGKLLHVRRDTVRLPDGGAATREYVVHPGAVLILPVLDDGRLVVERQFRYPLDRVCLEFPAGKLDHGEAPLDTARRELVEEAGFTARTWSSLGVIHPVIAYSTERIELCLPKASRTSARSSTTASSSRSSR